MADRGRPAAGGVLAVRPDGMGDVLLTGPAVRALAAAGGPVTFLAGPAGAGAARLLPGVSEVITWRVPWIDPDPPRVTSAEIAWVAGELRGRRISEAVIFTSFHQSPLPTALVLRMAGVPRISAISADYPGSLLDVRHRLDDDIPEARRALSLARAAGFRLPAGDAGELAVTRPLPGVAALTGPGPYVVLHPCASAPARAPSPATAAALARALAGAGLRVLVTGSPAQAGITARVAGGVAADLGGRTPLPVLAAVLAGAAAVVAPNTGVAHLAAAVGTPVVSLFAPVVPWERWRPYGVPTVRFGDPAAACAGSRARTCPVPGHPCLDLIDAGQVARAATELARLGGQALSGGQAPGPARDRLPAAGRCPA
jgi:ADP-heptose:LPS heptosyltransferase